MSATAVTNDLILIELDNGQQSLFCNPSLLVIISTETWEAFLDHIVPQWKECSSWGYKKDFVDETLYVLSSAWWLQGWNFNTTFLTHRGTKRSYFSSVQFSSVAQSCQTFCDPMGCSTPGLPVHHQLPEFTQTHVHWISQAIWGAIGWINCQWPMT